VGPQEQGPLKPLAGKAVCRKCHPRCKRCNGYGFHEQVRHIQIKNDLDPYLVRPLTTARLHLSIKFPVFTIFKFLNLFFPSGRNSTGVPGVCQIQAGRAVRG
jgi:hypothetical protein